MCSQCRKDEEDLRAILAGAEAMRDEIGTAARGIDWDGLSERIADAGKLKNVRVELDVLAAARDAAMAPSAELAELTAQLKQVNEALWEIEDAIRGIEVINQDKPSAEYHNLLGTMYNQIKNMPKAIESFKASYALKKNAQVAYNLGILLNQNQEMDSALEYLAEAHLLNDEKISPEALKLFEHLIFFEKTKGLPQPEQEMVYNELLAAAKIRLGITLP